MRRLDIINSVTKIQDAFFESKIYQTLNATLAKDRGNPEDIFKSFQTITNHAQRFNESDRKIIEIFELNDVLDPSFWAALTQLDKATSVRERVRKVYRGASFVDEFLGDIMVLLRQDHLQYSMSTDKTSVNPEDSIHQSILTVILPEDERHSSNPGRLIKTLQSIDNFYRSLAKLMECDENELSVVAIDSGSDKSFDFLGAAKVVTALKELIIELWDRIVFFREKKLHERLDLISKSLPIIEKINTLEKKKSIGQEEAELLRRNVIDAAKDFITAGAILPEFESNTNFNPRQLMAPEPKLLTTPDTTGKNGSNSIAEENPQSESDVEVKTELTEEQLEQIKNLLSKQNKKSPRKKSGS